MEAPRYAGLFAAIHALRPRRLMEIGVASAGNALEMIRAAQQYVEDPRDVEYYGFDLFGPNPDDEKDKTPVLSLEDATAKLDQTGARVHLFKGNTRVVLAELCGHVLQPMDLVFVDGGHSPGTIASDWQWVRRFMHRETVVFFDDYWPDHRDGGCLTTIEGIQKDPWYTVEVLQPQDIYRMAYQYGDDLRVNMVKVAHR